MTKLLACALALGMALAAQSVPVAATTYHGGGGFHGGGFRGGHGGGWRGGYGGYGWGWGPWVGGYYPYYGDFAYNDYGYGGPGCMTVRPVYDRYGHYLGRRTVDICQ